MPIDFTVILAVRQHFGDGSRDFKELLSPDGLSVESSAPFVGASKDFPFSCPNVDSRQRAVLLFESLGVQGGNVITINDVAIPGGITPGPQAIDIEPRIPLWKTHSILVPVNVLREENVLHIEATTNPFVDNLDNFIIDNAVVFFKIRRNPVGSAGENAPPE